MSHERPVEPFSDLHVEGGRVRATLLHDPTVEGLDMAIYMDGSGSMKEEYEYRQKDARLVRLASRRTQEVAAQPGRAAGAVDARVPRHQGPQRHPARRLLGVRQHRGKEIEVVGDLQGHRRRGVTSSPGPRSMGSETHLTPAIQRLRRLPQGADPEGRAARLRGVHHRRRAARRR